MPDKHLPHDEFVERLEWRVTHEARRLRQAAVASPWFLGSRLRLAVAAGLLVIVSMGMGAAGVAAAYQARGNEQRDLLAANYARRVDLARQRYALAVEQLRAAERQVAVGAAGRDSLVDQQFNVTEAQVAIVTIESQLQEVRLTGREPVDDLSAPVVSGRDFVGDRLRTAMLVPKAALDAAASRLHEAERRVQVGLAASIDVEVARVHMVEAQTALALLERKVALREQFLKGTLSRAQTDLRLLEAEAEQRRAALAPRVDLARRQVDRVNTMVQTGLAQAVELAEARLRFQEASAELAKADLDLELVRRQIAQGKTGGN